MTVLQGFFFPKNLRPKYFKLKKKQCFKEPKKNDLKLKSLPNKTLKLSKNLIQPTTIITDFLVVDKSSVILAKRPKIC